MSFYFQPPIFALQPRLAPATAIAPTLAVTSPRPLFLTATSLPTFQYHIPPTILYYSAFPAVAQIKIKVIFHGTQRPNQRPAPFYIPIDVSYDSAPSRETLLTSVSVWARQYGLGDRVNAGQATLYLTRNSTCPLVALGGGARFAPAVEDVVRTVALREMALGREFGGLMEETRGGRYGVFLIVDTDAGEVDQQEEEDNPPIVDPTPPGSDIQQDRDPPEEVVNEGNEFADT